MKSFRMELMLQEEENLKGSKAVRRVCRREILRELEAFSRDDLSRIVYYTDGLEQYDPRDDRLVRVKNLLNVLRLNQKL